MWDEIGKWLWEHCPQLIVGAIVFWIAWKIKGLYHRFQKTEKECDKIESKIAPTLLSLDKSIHALITFLTTKHTDLQIGLFQAQSPIQLTPIGTEILEAIGGKKYVDNNLPYLISEMEKETFKSGLDVEVFSQSLLVREINSDAFTPIKNYIFNNPIYKKDAVVAQLNLGTVTHIIGIYLRDKYFDKHPALKATL